LTSFEYEFDWEYTKNICGEKMLKKKNLDKENPAKSGT